jgi:hypothetical protein
MVDMSSSNSWAEFAALFRNTRSAFLDHCPPVRFRRPAGLLPLPIPQRGGSHEQIALLLNLSSQNDFVLVVSWLLAALRPSSPYPVLGISGERGSAKTVLSKTLRALVDPNSAPVRALPRLLGPSAGPMRQTAGLRSSALSTLIQSRA